MEAILAKQLEQIIVCILDRNALYVQNATVILINSNIMHVYLNWITISIMRGENGTSDEIYGVDGSEADGRHP